ncbi:MAG: hypothetical protein M1828_000190 [Chrysothrix sp. TS-e1954]|nr:MAG: hypothetical protein M1828_000190 [Chrysothrix sp. TS-e1954]
MTTTCKTATVAKTTLTSTITKTSTATATIAKTTVTKTSTLTKPPVTVTKPAVTITKPAVTVTKPAVTITKPAVTVTKPAVTTTSTTIVTKTLAPSTRTITSISTSTETSTTSACPSDSTPASSDPTPPSDPSGPSDPPSDPSDPFTGTCAHYNLNLAITPASSPASIPSWLSLQPDTLGYRLSTQDTPKGDAVTLDPSTGYLYAVAGGQTLYATVNPAASPAPIDFTGSASGRSPITCGFAAEEGDSLGKLSCSAAGKTDLRQVGATGEMWLVNGWAMADMVPVRVDGVKIGCAETAPSVG